MAVALLLAVAVVAVRRPVATTGAAAAAAIAGAGARPGGFWRNWTGRGRRGGDDPFDFDHEIFEEFFKSSAAGRRQSQTAEGGARQPNDASYKLTVPFREAAGGSGKRVTLSDGRVLDLKIPPGTEDGKTLRLTGPGRNNGD